MALTTDRILRDIEGAKTTLGIEYGSTRIKAVLDDSENNPIAVGTFDWENTFDGTYWTYGQDELVAGIQGAYASLKADVEKRYGVTLRHVGAMGVSAMMHGYLPFDADGALLVPFRTWRNTTTTVAARELTELFAFHIPERWSVSHIYQAVIDGEEHVSRIASFTTLAGYAHRLLTGENCLSVGDASGMFPIDSTTKDYDRAMIEKLTRASPSMVSRGRSRTCCRTCSWRGSAPATSRPTARACSTPRATSSPAARSALPRVMPARA